MIGLIGVFCGKTGELIIFTNLAPRTPHPRQPTLLTYTSFNRIQFRSNNVILYFPSASR